MFKGVRAEKLSFEENIDMCVAWIFEDCLAEAALIRNFATLNHRQTIVKHAHTRTEHNIVEAVNQTAVNQTAVNQIAVIVGMYYHFIALDKALTDGCRLNVTLGQMTSWKGVNR